MFRLQNKILIVLTLVSAGCALLAQPADSFQTTTSGLQFLILAPGEMPIAKNGDIVQVLFTGRLSDGSRFDGHTQRGGMVKFQLGKQQFPLGFEEGLKLIGKGGKARLIVPPELGYGIGGIAGFVPGNATLLYNIELANLRAPIIPVPYDTSGIIEQKAQGLRYFVVFKNGGEQAYANRLVTVHYTGYFEDGRIFDSSVERDEPFKFVLGVGQVIGGWDIGIRLMQVGDKFRLIIPPNLAYGKKGSGDITPNSTLIFDVELLSVEFQ